MFPSLSLLQNSRTVASACPPLIILKSQAESKQAAPGSKVMKPAPAFVKCLSSFPASGAGPAPIQPFSL